ncbi:MAG: tRNA 2-thiouridine(34) synthase MnmA [Marinilabiliaceae bacterium]|nr:tRNA 2-thiouridine(34) synthase MnmA [Marinilabiliaceae bacterium]
MKSNTKRVVIGLSGGVDSSVAAYILKQQGYDVVALFMKNWHDTTGVLKADCPWLDDKFDAEAVARKLNIPFHFVDLSEHYKKRVVDYMFSEYEKGRTPNPDILCNREIKFDVFMENAFKLGADYVATGHFCQKKETLINGQLVYSLLAGSDPNKDQSYFLCQLSQKQLEKVLFPIGNLHKSEVRKIATELNLVTANKKDSQGICFVGKVDLPVFLQQKLSLKKGDVFLVPADAKIFERNWEKALHNPDDDTLLKLSYSFPFNSEQFKKIGEHNGAHFYTVGQRKGLNIGGFAEPLFVLGTDVQTNQIFMGMGNKHPGLFRKVLKINNNEIHWIRDDYKLDIDQDRDLKVRIRYRQPLQDAILMQRKNGLFILFDDYQRGITPGQFAAWYKKNELIGSGVIHE